jgi:hypothetical protein
MSLEGDCYEIEVDPHMELLVTFDVSLEGVCHCNLVSNLEVTKNSLKKLPPN